MALEVTVNEQPALYFKDERGYIMTKEKFFEMMELARVFYESENIDEWIKKENRRNRWEHHRLLSTPVVNGKRILPKPNIKEKVFKKNRNRDWSFHCHWCHQKVSTQTHTSYFRIYESVDFDKKLEGNCCSRACAENLWYDLLIEWIMDEELTDLFHTDKTIKTSY